MSRDNRRLKDMRRLRRCKDSARALLEGPRLIHDACRAGVEIDYALATPGALADPAFGPALAALPRPPLTVEARLLEELADADSPRGLLAAARWPQRDLSALPSTLAAPLVYADGLQDPGNLGALARAAEAAGAAGLALASGSVNPRHPRALRASAGSLLRLAVAERVAAPALRERYPSPARGGEGPRWVALVPRGGVDLYGAELEAGVVLLLGAEGPGLSPATRALADVEVTVPLAPTVESLNTAVAAALVLFEIRRRQRLSPPSPRAPLR